MLFVCCMVAAHSQWACICHFTSLKTQKAQADAQNLPGKKIPSGEEEHG